MKKKVDSKVNSVVAYIVVFVVGLIIGHQLIIPNLTENASTTTLVPLPNTENFSASTYVLAVNSDQTAGVAGRVFVEIYPGKGRVLMDTNPFLEPDTQQSAETAVKVAENYTGMSLKDRDVIVSFNITGNVLGGPSAGAAMTVVTIAAIEGKKVKDDVAITGTIDPSGNVGVIGGVVQKAEVASKNGVKLFLVPKDLLTLTYYERQITRQNAGPGFAIQRVRYVPKTLDLNNYTMTELKMETKGVSTINDVAKYMLG
jgi:predicted S18 family serine protease